MKLRDLRHGQVTVWPPQWVDTAGSRDGVPDDGVLDGLERFGQRLLLRINVQGNRRTASLVWDVPPTVGDVEAVLLASIGSKVRDLGERELPIFRSGGPPR